MRIAKNLIYFIADVAFSKFCLGCGKEGQYICSDCEILLNEAQTFEENLFCLWEYGGIIEKAICKIKFKGFYHIIDELVEKAYNKTVLNFPENTCLSYVPMFKKREKERGFNQAELIAKKLGEKLGMPVAKLLIKVKDNKSQVGLNPQERQENVKGVFGTDPSQEIPKNILLVDDVYTTGATIKECIKILKKAGAENVWCFTLTKKINI